MAIGARQSGQLQRSVSPSSQTRFCGRGKDEVDSGVGDELMAVNVAGGAEGGQVKRMPLLPISSRLVPLVQKSRYDTLPVAPTTFFSAG